MTSKKTKGSPIASLINQWSNQQDHSNYRILLQHTTGLTTRLQAANSTDLSLSRQTGEEIVYRRAGLRTPAETSLRDLFGGSAWLLRLVEAGVESDLDVLFVRTLARPSFLAPELLSKVKVVDLSRDPWGWEDEEKESKVPSLQDLTGLFESLRSMLMACEGKPAMLIWESLTPLVVVHEFDRLLRFLEALDKPLSRTESMVRVLQVWPVRTETLTASQHSRFEDASNALLHLKRGEMTFLRQGIREAGNVVREIMPFRLVPQEAARGGSLLSYRLEEVDDTSHLDEETVPGLHDEESSLDVTTTGDNQMPQQYNPGRSRISLQIESDDIPASRPSKSEPIAQEHRPRIFLQDNDPEFDDMDDEDPDDDLDF